MRSDEESPSAHERWAHLRFSVVGPLLAAPPKKRELAEAFQALARKTWLHPITRVPTQFGYSTIERWYYAAKNAAMNPVRVLRKKVRKDVGQQWSLTLPLRTALHRQYKDHSGWSVQLHTDNLAAQVKKHSELGRMPSYATIRRFMAAQGWFRRKRRGPKGSPGGERAERRIESREVRSFEAEYVHGLYHADFHVGSLKILRTKGEWIRPHLLGVLDDRSRLCCHVQWYLTENARFFVHGVSQAFQKRGLSGQMLTDNGTAETAAECTAGFARLGVLHETTLPYSPYQNAKQEVFWAQVEGRLLAMLEGVNDLSLDLLNEATQAWVEMEYNRKIHSETGQTPLDRFLQGPSVGRVCPSSEDLRLAFTAQETRSQRRSDGTVSLEAVRFEIPNRYRHLQRVTLRFVHWDLSRAWLVDEKQDLVLCPVFPLDKNKNADGLRRWLTPGTVPEPPTPSSGGIAPLLKDLMAEYAKTGLPPAYLPTEPSSPRGES